VNGVSDFSINGSSLIDWVSDDIHDSAKSLGSYWDSNWSSSIVDLLSSDQSLCGIHGDCSHSGVSQMLSDFKY